MDSNCPNCGAPITGSKCEYCGTIHKSGEFERFNEERQKLLEKKAALELQAAQSMANANLAKSIRPYFYQNTFYYPLETDMQTLQESRDALQRMQDRSLIDYINLGLQAANKRL